MTCGPRSASRSEERILEERLPACEPSRIPAPTEQSVRGGDDRGAFVKYLGRSETHSLVVDLYQAAIPSKVTVVHQAVAMDTPVENQFPPCLEHADAPHRSVARNRICGQAQRFVNRMAEVWTTDNIPAPKPAARPHFRAQQKS